MNYALKYKSANIGDRFGRLVVIETVGSKRRICLCDCGETKEVSTGNLVTGNTTSCGCYRREVEIVAGLKHGCTSNQKWTGEYGTWHNIKQRCYNKNNSHYKHYGGRGITVCDRWKNSFENFLEDMGPRPDKHSIERVDNNMPYSKENCVWATINTQANNRRNNVTILFNDETLTISEWADKTGIPYFTLHSRLKRGWPLELALTSPVSTKNCAE